MICKLKKKCFWLFRTHGYNLSNAWAFTTGAMWKHCWEWECHYYPLGAASGSRQEHSIPSLLAPSYRPAVSLQRTKILGEGRTLGTPETNMYLRRTSWAQAQSPREGHAQWTLEFRLERGQYSGFRAGGRFKESAMTTPKPPSPLPVLANGGCIFPSSKEVHISKDAILKGRSAHGMRPFPLLSECGFSTKPTYSQRS